jgi:hypothetical protein
MNETQFDASVNLCVVVHVEFGVQLLDVNYCLIKLLIVHLLELAGSLLDRQFIKRLALPP